MAADHSWVFGCFWGVFLWFFVCLFCVCFTLLLLVLFLQGFYLFFFFFFDECYKTQEIINKIWKNAGKKIPTSKNPTETKFNLH